MKTDSPSLKICSLILSLTTALTATSAQTPRAHSGGDDLRTLNLGFESVKNGKFEQAMSLYDSYRNTKVKNFADGSLRIATILSWMGRKSESISEYKKVLKMNRNQFVSSAVSSGLVQARMAALYLIDRDIDSVASIIRIDSTTIKMKSSDLGNHNLIQFLLSSGKSLGDIYDIQGRDLVYSTAFSESHYNAEVGYEFSRKLAATQQYRSAISVLKKIHSPTSKELTFAIKRDLDHYSSIIQITSWPKTIEAENTKAIAKYREARLSNFKVLGM